MTAPIKIAQFLNMFLGGTFEKNSMRLSESGMSIGSVELSFAPISMPNFSNVGRKMESGITFT